jgi:hypothetical protein
MNERYGIGQLRQKTLINQKIYFCVLTRRIAFMNLTLFRLIFEDMQMGGGGGIRKPFTVREIVQIRRLDFCSIGQ